MKDKFRDGIASYLATAEARPVPQPTLRLEVTLANDGVERFEGHVIRVIPAWRWLLEA